MPAVLGQLAEANGWADLRGGAGAGWIRVPQLSPARHESPPRRPSPRLASATVVLRCGGRSLQMVRGSSAIADDALHCEDGYEIATIVGRIMVQALLVYASQRGSGRSCPRAR